MRSVMKYIFVALCMACSAAAFAQTDAQLWNSANDAYSMGQYESAYNDYKSIEQGGTHSYKLYYNMGNACYKMGEVGKAILYYEKALKLDPAGEDAKINLQIARLQTLDKIDVVPEFILATLIKDVRNALSSNGWAYLAIAFLAVTAVLMLLFRFAPTTGQRKFSFVLACVVFLFAIISVLFAVNLRRNASSEDSAIVMVPVSNIKSAPNSTGNNLFILHEGTKVEILEEAGQWCRIEISDGRQGWMHKSDVEVI